MVAVTGCGERRTDAATWHRVQVARVCVSAPEPEAEDIHIIAVVVSSQKNWEGWCHKKWLAVQPL